METFRVQCDCGQAVPAPAGAAGSTVACRCGRAVPVPALRELRRRAAAEEAARPPAEAGPPPDRTVPAGLAAAGTAVTLLGLGLLVGNCTGLFPTFPFAGFAVMALGSLLFVAAQRAGEGE